MTGVIIQARMGSTRMPEKTMKKISDKPLLYYSHIRSKIAKYVDEVIIATTTNEIDDFIANWCEENNIKYYRGSEDDVLDRYYNAAKEYNLDTIVRVTSDCPFVEPKIIDTAILLKDIYNVDYVSNRIKTRTWPHGLDIECFDFTSLEKAWNNAKEKSEREHVTPYILKNPDLFSHYEFSYTKDISDIRVTVDYPEDFEMADKLLNILIYKHGIGFNLNHLLKEIDTNPEIMNINRNRVNSKL